MNAEVFSQIGTQERDPQSVPETYFRSWMRKECSDREYHAGVADWVASNLFKYSPRRYPQLPGQLQSYVDRRLKGFEGRNHDNAVDLGCWIQTVVKYQSANESDLKLLIWCQEKLEAVGLVERAKNVAAHLRGFNQELPGDDLLRACEVLKKDHDERMNSEKVK